MSQQTHTHTYGCPHTRAVRGLLAEPSSDPLTSHRYPRVALGPTSIQRPLTFTCSRVHTCPGTEDPSLSLIGY